MKLTAAILFFACMHVSAHSYSQTVSFSGKNVPLQAVFASLEKQTGLSFFFNYALVKDIKPVTLEVENVPMEEALNKVLKQEGLDFYKTGKTIFIVKREVRKVISYSEVDSNKNKQSINVSGRVTNHQGIALAGATILVKGGKSGTITDEKGIFELKNVPLGGVLEISFLGYEKKEVVIDSKNYFNVELALTNNKLDEVQVIAYGNTTQRNSTGDVTTVKADAIEKQPVTNPLLAIEGRVAGLFITQTNGIPGGGVKVIIQGQNSIGNGNDPLYVVDGVPYVSQLLPNSGTILGASGNQNSTVNGFGNPLNYISPSDIESISVLKDADATAIYGSRAANGAILITTKKGKVGVTSSDINFQQGWGKVAKKASLLNTAQYLEMRHEALNNDLISAPGPADFDINGLWDTTRTTDWQKQLIGGTAQYQNAIISFSGGTTNTQYLIGANWHRETTVFPGNFSDQKGGVHFSINSTSTNQRLHIQLSGSYLVDNNKLLSTDLTSQSMVLAPDAPKLYTTDDSLNWAPTVSGSSSWINPLSYAYNTYQNKSNNLISNFIVGYHILPSLDIKASIGYSKLSSSDVSKVPLIGIRPERRPTSLRRGTFGTYSIDSWIAEPQINYIHDIGSGKFDFLAGLSFQQNANNSESIVASGFTTDQAISNMGSATTFSVSSAVSQYKYNAIFGRLNYSLASKYIFNFTIRRDGSSRFGGANQLHNFGSAGAAWIFSNESFVSKKISFLSFGKLRASYGLTGNDQIGNYNYLSLYNVNTGGVPYQASAGLLPAGLDNPYLKWEETKKIEVGLDLGFLRDRMLLNASYFHNRSSNQLLPYNLPIITGFSSITENFPATVQNTGIELSINTTNIKSNNFNWTSNFNLTIPRNKLIAFPNLQSSSYYNSLIIGKSLSIVKLYHLIGVNDTTGSYQFSDSKGGLTYQPTVDDMTMSIDLAPRYYGGFENSFNYKKFTIDFLFQFVKQLGQSFQIGNDLPGIARTNQPVSVLKRWQRTNPRRNIQQFNSDFSLYTQYSAATLSSIGYTDASYIRLKNISLAWQIIERQNKFFLQSVKLFIQAQNLLTFTRYKELDPETRSNSSLPPLRVITFGSQISL